MLHHICGGFSALSALEGSTEGRVPLHLVLAPSRLPMQGAVALGRFTLLLHTTGSCHFRS